MLATGMWVQGKPETGAAVFKTFITALLLAAAPAQAASGPWVASDMGEARLVAAVEATGALENIPLGLELKLKPGWKTYWRSPGDAGLAPAVDWKGSGNLTSGKLNWPAPHRFTILGLETFGYKDAVVFPIDGIPATPGKALDLKAKVDLLVCEKLCVPKTLDLTLTLPAGTEGRIRLSAVAAQGHSRAAACH